MLNFSDRLIFLGHGSTFYNSLCCCCAFVRVNGEHHAELLHFCQNTETSGRRPHKIINDPSVHWLQVNVSSRAAVVASLAAAADSRAYY